jgi:MFS family permease
VLFTPASLLTGLAPCTWWLIAAPAYQGIGAAILVPASLSLLTASFAEDRGSIHGGLARHIHQVSPYQELHQQGHCVLV